MKEIFKPIIEGISKIKILQADESLAAKIGPYSYIVAVLENRGSIDERYLAKVIGRTVPETEILINNLQNKGAIVKQGQKVSLSKQ